MEIRGVLLWLSMGRKDHINSSTTVAINEGGMPQHIDYG